MDFVFIYTSLILITLTTILVLELIEVDIAIFSALILLVIGGVIDVKEAFSGFSNHGMLTVAFLFVVAGALQKTAAIDQFGHVVLGRGGENFYNFIKISSRSCFNFSFL